MNIYMGVGLQCGESDVSSHSVYLAVPGGTVHTTHYRLSTTAMRAHVSASVNPWGQ